MVQRGDFFGVESEALGMNGMEEIALKCAFTRLTGSCQWCSILTPELQESLHRPDQYSQHTLQRYVYSAVFFASGTKRV